MKDRPTFSPISDEFSTSVFPAENSAAEQRLRGIRLFRKGNSSDSGGSTDNSTTIKEKVYGTLTCFNESTCPAARHCSTVKSETLLGEIEYASGDWLNQQEQTNKLLAEWTNGREPSCTDPSNQYKGKPVTVYRHTTTISRRS